MQRQHCETETGTAEAFFERDYDLNQQCRDHMRTLAEFVHNMKWFQEGGDAAHALTSATVKFRGTADGVWVLLLGFRPSGCFY